MKKNVSRIVFPVLLAFVLALAAFSFQEAKPNIVITFDDGRIFVSSSFDITAVAYASPGWGFVAHRGSANNKTAGTTIAMNPTANLAVNSAIIIRCVSDNPAGAGGQTNCHSVSDSKSNTWTKIREQTNSPGGAAGDGVTSSFFISKITTQISTTDAITLTISSSVTAKAIGADEFSIGAGNSITVVGNNAATGSSTAPSVTLSGLTSAEYLWIGHVGIEGPNADTFTQAASYANNTSFGTDVAGPTTNVASRFGSRIYAGASDTYAPTLGTSRDWVNILAAVKENVPSISNAPTEYGFGTVDANSSYWSGSFASFPLTDGQCNFTVTNDGSVNVNITMKSTNFTGGTGWTLAGGSVGSNQVVMKAGKSGDAEGNMVTIAAANTEYTFITNLPHTTGNTKKWVLKLETGTFTDNAQKSATIILTATAA